ncbi:MAG: 50S ribosomal protein L3 [Alphaproteobacteria bacterium CG_4_10_14_0_2_um_filter_63_37]|nr:MAG: 50S ribosomal protein L3 [Proteobacteria bacterium CG1_02_64_396]PJA25552.1 MAG: 50S ribosomal protein L3 [Alphaproteobacteria bacterium CG_4_10_14_0_2_um_filter_63_37]
MATGLIGRKLGMTRVFQEDGQSVPVTVIQLGPCKVVQIKTPENDGYAAVQLGFEDAKPSRVNGPQRGHFAKAGIEPLRNLREFRIEDPSQYQVGQELDVSQFSDTEYVDVTGTSIGKGFQGVMKRHGFGGLRATHGVSISHRSPGSIGNRQTPGRVFKNKKMAGHMGAERVTTQNLKVVQVRAEESVLLVEGSVPGHAGSLVYVNTAVKKGAKA